MWGHSVYTAPVLLGAPQRLASWIQLLAILGAASSSSRSDRGCRWGKEDDLSGHDRPRGAAFRTL
jgi:hypothetical protein